MELRAFAERILASPAIAAKIAPPDDPPTDEAPGAPVFWERPARPPELAIRTRRTRVAMPKPTSFSDPGKRGLALHFFANHELQALELMAFALLAYPAAPREMRAGLYQTLRDEQRHLALYLERMAALGVRFGCVPVNDYFWGMARHLETPLHYLAALPLALEGGNLDRAVGDEESARLMRTIHDDEVHHVRFGVTWLRRLKEPGRSDWEVFAAHLVWPMRPARARGPVVRRASRLLAGMDEDFVARLEAVVEPPYRS
jgi:uncharacterized ferritin-like protein (DUF455 family)